MRVKKLLIALLLAAGPWSPLFAADQLFEFYQEEATVQTGSHQPQKQGQIPGTVYVVTAQDIKDSGALTIPEVLRTVPGVDVIQERTGAADVTIRGLSRPINNRTLVLLDGKTVLNGYYDYLTWESLPITMDEIDRIEILEGPASAIYGANAVSGVINIITKTPQQLHGGILHYQAGERNTEVGTFNYGTEQGKLSYKLGGGWDSTNRFEDASRPAAQAGKFDALVRYAGEGKSFISASGGVNQYEAITTTGGTGTINDKGLVSFARTDARWDDTQFRAFWNHGRTTPEEGDLGFIDNRFIDFDTYDAEIDQSLELPFHQSLTLGANYRKNTARSDTFAAGTLASQDLWALFFEDKWDIAEHWTFNGSGRLDRHPLTPYQFSPRGSLMYTPVPEQTFRFSAGTSFRQPTLLENNVDLTVVTPNPLAGTPGNFDLLSNHQLGSQQLDPERMEYLELGHEGRFGILKTRLTGFHYKIKDLIDYSPAEFVGTSLEGSTAFFQRSFINNGEVTANGGEAALDAQLTSWLSSFANYSYQDLKETPAPESLAKSSPRHKANLGLKVKENGWTASLTGDWVDKTEWATVSAPGPDDMAPLPAYWLLNAHVGYAFSGSWDGLDVGLNVFNLLNHDHYEVLPALGLFEPGMSGEVIKQRITGTVSYRFK